jgi:hypothetical protein
LSTVNEQVLKLAEPVSLLTVQIMLKSLLQFRNGFNQDFQNKSREYQKDDPLIKKSKFVIVPTAFLSFFPVFIGQINIMCIC